MGNGTQKNHDNWPTRENDQTIAIDILKRHSERFGYVKALERVGQLSDQGGGTFEVEFPPWMHELTTQFQALYGSDVGHDVFLKTVRWLMREIFGGHAAISFD